MDAFFALYHFIKSAVWTLFEVPCKSAVAPSSAKGAGNYPAGFSGIHSSVNFVEPLVRGCGADPRSFRMHSSWFSSARHKFPAVEVRSTFFVGIVLHFIKSTSFVMDVKPCVVACRCMSLHVNVNVTAP